MAIRCGRWRRYCLYWGLAPSTLGREHDHNTWFAPYTGAKGQEWLEGLYYPALFMSASAAFANVLREGLGAEGMSLLSLAPLARIRCELSANRNNEG
jgi:hypothetical protein